MKIIKPLDSQFGEVVHLIKKARLNALRSVNQELIELYRQIGSYISARVESEEWGKGVVTQLAVHLRERLPDSTGYSSQNLWRMKQFYEAYRKYPKLSTLLRELGWSSHLHIISKTKTIEEKEFYLRLAIKERYSVHSESDLSKGIVSNLKNFVLEFGKDFAFVGQEYRIQVGKNDYFIDLLFFHRGLRCLVMFELKIDDFKPEYLSKLNFYLEALDRDVRNPDENPSVGIILCKSKDDEVVEYALSRNLSPALVAEYKTKLIPKKILQKKLHEYYLLGESGLKKEK